MTTLKDRLCSMLNEKAELHGYDESKVIYLDRQEEVEDLSDAIIEVIKPYLIEEK